MSETSNAAETIEHWTKRIVQNEQGRKILGEQTERFWKAEDSFVDDLHDYFENWCERRHDAAQSAIEFGKLMEDGVDNADVMKAWTDLWSNAFQRFGEDAQAQVALYQKFISKAGANSFGFAFPVNAAGGSKDDASRDE